MSLAEGRTARPHSSRALIGLLLESAEDGRNPSQSSHMRIHTLAQKKPRTCTLIKSARRGLGQTEVIVQGGEREGEREYWLH